MNSKRFKPVVNPFTTPSQKQAFLHILQTLDNSKFPFSENPFLQTFLKLGLFFVDPFTSNLIVTGKGFKTALLLGVVSISHHGITLDQREIKYLASL